MTTPPFPPVSDADLAVLRAQLGRPARGVVGIAARCVCGNPTVAATLPRLPDGTPFPTFYYLSHPAATAAMSTLEADHVMRELGEALADEEDVAAAYAAAHEAYLRDRAHFGEVPEIEGISAGGMPTRVKCLHALAAHALAAGPGVNPIGDRALVHVELVARAVRLRGAGDRGVKRLVGASLVVALVGILAGAPGSAPAAGTRTDGQPSVAAVTASVLPQSAEDPVRSAEYWLDEYGIRTAWQTTRGSGVRIAIVDTGIGREPTEFKGAVVGGTDVSGQGSPDGRTPVGAVDANHGSWVASLAAGRGTGPGAGMIGVAPEADLLAVSVGFGAAQPGPSPTRSPTPSGGPSTTAPMSSTCR